jgi:hypothetical protein
MDARYRQLMQSPLGVYLPQFDPLTALGIEARSDAAWQRLFPGHLRGELGEAIPSGMTTGTR